MVSKRPAFYHRPHYSLLFIWSKVQLREIFHLILDYKDVLSSLHVMGQWLDSDYVAAMAAVPPSLSITEGRKLNNVVILLICPWLFLIAKWEVCFVQNPATYLCCWSFLSHHAVMEQTSREPFFNRRKSVTKMCKNSKSSMKIDKSPWTAE